MKNDKIKILITGVGGQGVVFLTDLVVEAALREGLDVNASEIHGLTQRGGSVTASVTIGENTFGFIGKADADVLLSLELLEAQRCIHFLHADSVAVIDNYSIIPNTVYTGKAEYPESLPLIDFLEKNIKQLIVIDEEMEFKPVFRNLYLLGKFSTMDACPFSQESIEAAIRQKAKPEILDESLAIFRSAIEPYKKPLKK